MKKLFVIISFVLMAAISQAQAVKGVVMKDGINAGGTNISNAEMKTLDGINTAKTIATQLGETVKTSEVIKPLKIKTDSIEATVKMVTPTKAVGTNSTDVANTAWVQGELLYYPRKVDTGTNALITHTGTTNETALKTFPISSTRTSVNGKISIKCLFDATSSGNNKYYNVKINGSVMFYVQVNTSSMVTLFVDIVFQNSKSAQAVYGATATGGTISAINTPVNQDAKLTTYDFTGDLTVTINGQLANGSETIYLYSTDCTTTYY